LSIAEALIESRAIIWFATHFRELAQIMSERTGVVNLHFSVDMSQENTMTMLYKISEGFVKQEHYGLSMARVVDLPPKILEVAERVSRALDAQAEAKKKSSLIQAESGSMEGKILLNWLRRLQEEFVRRMDQIENDVTSGENEDVEEAESEVHIQCEESGPTLHDD